MEKTKYCVTTATIGGVTKTGIFTWTGKSWHTAQLMSLVKELPAGANLTKEYKDFVKARKSVKPAKCCVDCGQEGELTGHMGCMYPGSRS